LTKVWTTSSITGGKKSLVVGEQRCRTSSRFGGSEEWRKALVRVSERKVAALS